jgi:hypothetical protein
MNSLDRFSRPLASERFNHQAHQEALEEQRYLNKRDMVASCINDYVDEYNRFPSLDMVMEHFEDIDLDTDLVQDALNSITSATKLLPLGEF